MSAGGLAVNNTGRDRAGNNVRFRGRKQYFTGGNTKLLKKVFSALVIAGLSTGTVMAQMGSATDPVIPEEVSALQLQAEPGSAVKAVSGRFGLDEDNFVDVINYSQVEFEKTYFFLGGNTGIYGVQGGFAKKLSGMFSYVGFYMNGRLFDGNGSNNGKDNGDLMQVEGETTWNNRFALMFASESIGGIRLDVIMEALKFSSGENGKLAGVAKRVENSGNLTTSIQWGKSMGKLTPKVTLGIKWPEYEMTEPQTGPTQETWKNAALGLKAEVAAGNISGDYQLTINFGTTNKADKTTTDTGYWDNTLNVYYAINAPVSDKLLFKVRPQARLRLAGKENKTDNDGKVIYSGAPVTWFMLSPIVETGLEFKATKRLALYTGLKLTLFTLSTAGKSKYKSDGLPEVKDTPSAWKVKALSLTNIEGGSTLDFAADFTFTSAMSLNFSFSSDLFGIDIPGSNSAGFSVQNPLTNVNTLINGARLVLNFKPGA
ncbi:MAG: hypothetical protein LBC77_07010 [Spirochaetaceae bacterium]|jgi:hypothetical protein|nr:hypothetical protein [Spirochaetaceae bacterium]